MSGVPTTPRAVPVLPSFTDSLRYSILQEDGECVQVGGYADVQVLIVVLGVPPSHLEFLVKQPGRGLGNDLPPPLF